MGSGPILELTIQPEGRVISFQPSLVALVAFSGRDQEAVRAHIEELQELGVKAPETCPVIYTVTTDRVTTADKIEVMHGETSGELEFAVIVTSGERYVTVASDHTDRRSEAIDIGLAKQAVQRVLTPAVWRVQDVRSGWDAVTLRSWVQDDGTRRLYQSGTAADLLPVDELVDFVQKRSSRPVDEAVIFSGTIPVLNGGVCYSPSFEMEMRHPGTGWELRSTYHVNVNDWLRGND